MLIIQVKKYQNVIKEFKAAVLYILCVFKSGLNSIRANVAIEIMKIAEDCLTIYDMWINWTLDNNTSVDGRYVFSTSASYGYDSAAAYGSQTYPYMTGQVYGGYDMTRGYSPTAASPPSYMNGTYSSSMYASTPSPYSMSQVSQYDRNKQTYYILVSHVILSKKNIDISSCVIHM